MNSYNLKAFGAELLHYGHIYEKDDFSTSDGFITIRIIYYESGLYYTKQVDGAFTNIKLLKYPV